MAIELFAPKREDGRAYWRVLFDHIVERLDDGSADKGTLLAHDELCTLLAPEARRQYPQAIRRCARELREQRGRSLRSVRGKGYRIIGGMDIADQGGEYKRKGQRTLQRGLAVIQATPYSELSSGERNTVDLMQRGMLMLANVTRQNWERLNRHERELQALSSNRIEDRAQMRATQEQVDDIQRQLDELKRQRG